MAKSINDVCRYGDYRDVSSSANVRLYWEPRGPWPDDVVRSVGRELGLLHAVDPFVRPSLTPDVLYWRLHGNTSSYARYTDDELLQLISWLPTASGADAYVLFNNIPRVEDVQRLRELAPDAFRKARPGPTP